MNDAAAEQTKIAVLSSKIHSQISRKIAVENIIPIVIHLKRLMEQRRSPLLKQVMLYLREVVKDFRVEMEDLFVSDRQLAREIEFDLRQFEQQQKQALQNLPIAVVAGAQQPTVVPAVADEKVSFKAPFPKVSSQLLLSLI
jgi:hypothetical protein